MVWGGRYSLEWYMEEAARRQGRIVQEEEPLAPALIGLAGILAGTAVLLASRN